MAIVFYKYYDQLFFSRTEMYKTKTRTATHDVFTQIPSKYQKILSYTGFCLCSCVQIELIGFLSPNVVFPCFCRLVCATVRSNEQ